MTSYRQSMKDTLEIMYAVREASLMERDLTPDEEKRREEIAKDLPDDDFKKRYGDKWKSVKMATATKMMKNEKVEVDDEDDDEGDEEEKLTRPGGPMDEGVIDEVGGSAFGGTIDKIQKVVDDKQAMKIDGVMVDTFTASLIMNIFNKVNKQNKDKMRKMKVTQLANAAYKLAGVKEGKMQEEVELDEKMSPSDQDRLDDLLIAYRWGKSSYGFDDYNDVPNPDDVVKLIRKEFGNKIADQLVKSDDKIKVGYGGPSDRKTPTRITKTGKANKADLNALKTRLKKKRDWDKIAPKGKLPEEVELDEAISASSAYALVIQQKDGSREIVAKGSKEKMKTAAKKYGGLKQGKVFISLTGKKVGDKILGIGEETELDEGKMGDQWQKGAKSVKSGPFELMRGKNGVHAIMQNGKKLGDFSYDDEADNFVANMKGMKGQWVGNDIDSLINHLQKVHKEEVELDEKVDKEKLKGAPPQSVLWGIKDGQFGGRLKYAYPTLQKMHDKELPKHAFNNFSKFDGDRTAYIKDLIARGVDKPLSKAAQKEIDKIIKDVTTKPKKEEVDLDEGKMSQLHQYIKDKKSPEQIAKLMKLDVKTIKALMNSHHPEEVEESKTTVPMSTKVGQSVKKGQVPKGMYGNAARDARRAMGRDPEMRQRAFSKDDSASDDDQKGASKNIIMQLRKAGNRASMGVEFQDGKKIQIPAKLAMAVQQKYNSLPKPADKEKFQSKIAKSYRDMLNALKEEAVSPAQQAAIAISKKERGEKPKKESILDRIDRKIKENKNG